MMDFSIDRGDCLQGLSLTQGVVERRNTLPILANVLLEAKGSDLFLTASDLEVHIKYRCAAKVRTPGAATLAARRFFEFVRELKPGELGVRLLENQFVEVVSGRSRVKLVGLPAADFPAFPKAEKGSSTFSLRGEVLARMIDSTLFAVSTDETRAHLGGVHLSAQDGQLRFVGTDGHRLALIEEPVSGAQVEPKGIILPRKGLTELRKLLESGEGEAKLTTSGNSVRIERGNVELVMRLIDGEFPNYEQVIPKSVKHAISVEKAEFLSALRRVSVVASDRARGVKLQVSSGQLTVSASSADFGEASAEIEIAYDGEPIGVGFNSRYLTDVLAVLPDDRRVEIGLSDDVSPGVIRVEDDEAYRYIVMPMRL
jgi:DNA polymerase-3 subunit beta